MRDNSETRDQSLDENVHVLPETQAATLLLLLQAQHVISLRCLCNKTDFHPTVISLTHLPNQTQEYSTIRCVKLSLNN